jgi:hypothetical protein
LYSRVVSAALIALSTLALAATASAQQPAPAPSSWTMPGNQPAIAIAVAPAPAPAEPPAPADAPAFAPQPLPGPQAEAPREQARRPRDWHVDLGVGTELPLSVGGLLTVEAPHRLLFQLGVGVMPRAYAEAIDGFLTSSGAYDAVVSQIVRASLGNSLVLRASIGGRPFADHGFEILGGYTLMTLGGSVATTDAINAVLIQTGYPYQVPAGSYPDLPLSATLHNFHASIGWRWLVADERLVLRASLSYIQTLASRVTVDIPASAGQVALAEGTINEQINAFLGPYFAKYAKAPTLGLSAAFRF